MILGWFVTAVLMGIPVVPAPLHAQQSAPAGADSTTASPVERPVDILVYDQLPRGRAHDWQTGLLRADRLQHASLAFAIGCGAGLVTERPAAGAAIALSLGIAKELVDDRFDRGDLIADALGAALAAWAVAALTRGGDAPP